MVSWCDGKRNEKKTTSTHASIYYNTTLITFVCVICPSPEDGDVTLNLLYQTKAWRYMKG